MTILTIRSTVHSVLHPAVVENSGSNIFGYLFIYFIVYADSDPRHGMVWQGLSCCEIVLGAFLVTTIKNMFDMEE
jgi:hypothetical protein